MVIGIRLLIPMLRNASLRDSIRSDMGRKDTRERRYWGNRDMPNQALEDEVARGMVLGDRVDRSLVLGEMEDKEMRPRETNGAKDTTLVKRPLESILFKRRRTTSSISMLLTPAPNLLH